MHHLHTRAEEVSWEPICSARKDQPLLTLTNRSGAGFAACRFFTGLAEAPFFPGITLSKPTLRNPRGMGCGR